MFSKHKNPSSGFQSTWKTEQSLASDGTQTEEVKSEDGGCQVIEQAEAGTQTDEEKVKPQSQAEYDEASLAAFLQRIAPKVIKELERQNRSQAFAGYALRREEEEGEAKARLLHTLRCKQVYPEMVVTGLAWSSTGAVIGVGYGANQHEDWCDHSGAVAIWNINRNDFDSNQPERVIEVSSCVLCLAFHPTNPAIFAVGTFNGEVSVYNLSRTEDVTPVTTCECGGGAVTTVTWAEVGQAGAVTTTSIPASLITTTSTGYVLVWTLSLTKLQFTLKTGFIVRSEDVPRGGRTSVNEKSGLGITAASFNSEDNLLFLLGGVGGRLFICNAASEIPTGVEYGNVELKACVSSTLSSHAGKVIAAEFSPYHRNAVLTAGTDDQVRLYTLLQANKPVCSVHSQEGLTCARWSPYRPVVVATGRVSGQVAILDLASKSGEPLLTLPPLERPAAISTLEFNHRNVKLLSVGDQLGRVQIWQLPTNAVSPLPNETALLRSLLIVNAD